MKIEGFPIFKASWPWPWNWIGSYCIPSCITHWPTYMPNVIEIKETFCGRRDGRTYVWWTDGRTFETHFIMKKSRP